MLRNGCPQFLSIYISYYTAISIEIDNISDDGLKGETCIEEVVPTYLAKNRYDDDIDKQDKD